MDEPLKGKKTYIGMVLIGVWGIVGTFGIVPTEIWGAIMAIIGSATGVSMRLAIDKRK